MKNALSLLAFALLAACADEDPAPSVAVMAATPDELTPSDDTRDDLTITVEYDDADGDLGMGVAEVHDCRGDGLVTELSIPAIAPEMIIDEGHRITGTLALHVSDVGALAPGAPPEVCRELDVADLEARTSVFCVVLVDGAGHRGTGDCTGVIALAD